MKSIWKLPIVLVSLFALASSLAGCGRGRSSNPVAPKSERPPEAGNSLPAAETSLKVRSLIEAGKAGEAEAAARKQIGKQPKNAEAHFLLGKALLAKGDRPGARASFEKARSLEPSYASYGRALVELWDTDAREAIKADDPAGAIEAWKQCLALRYKPSQTEKNLAEAFRRLGEKLVAENKRGEAENAFREAATLLPDNPVPRLDLANMFLADDRLQEAHRELRELSKTHPNFEEGLTAYASVQRRMGDARGAMDTVKHVLALNASNAEAKALRGELENEVPVKQLEEAGAKLISVDEPTQELVQKLGELESAGDLTGQASLLQNTLEEAPGLLWAKLRLATIEERLGNASASLPLVQSYLGERPDDIRARFLLARVLQQSGALDEALQTLVALEREGKANLQVFDEIGQIQAKKGKFAEAKSSWKKALELDPEYPGALFNFGQLAMEEGKSPDAQVWLDKALAREPFNMKFRYFTGLNLKQAGKTKEAKAVWEGGNAVLNPQDPYAQRIAAALGKKLAAPPVRYTAPAVVTVSKSPIPSTAPDVAVAKPVETVVGLETPGSTDAGTSPRGQESAEGAVGEFRSTSAEAVSAVSVLPSPESKNPGEAVSNPTTGPDEGGESSTAPVVNITGTLPAADSKIISTTLPANEDPVYQQGLAAARASQYTDAEAAFVQVLSRNPKHFNAWVNLGNVYAATGKPADAAARYLRALKLNPGNGFARKALDKAYSELGLNPGEKNLLTGDDTPVGVNDARQRSNPRSFEPIARAYLRGGLTEEALSVARIAVDQNPDNIDLRVLQGEVLGAAGRSDAAESAFQKAIEMDKTSPNGYLKLGEFLAGTGRKDAAFNAYDQVIKSKFADPETLLTLSDRLKEIGRTKEAADTLGRVKGMNLSEEQMKRLQQHQGGQ
ncbi:MAG: tetratricopeptide repeat protein [Candidatus Ozemobacteraceae bacterium]